MALQKTRRVSRREPCPICKRDRWCLVAKSGKYAICMRVTSDRQALSGGWVHQLGYSPATHYSGPRPSGKPGRATKEAPRARPEECARVYRKLLDVLPLRDDHRAQLLARGFTPEAIQARGYRTLPESRGALCRQLRNGHPDELLGIPGFYKAHSATGFPYWTIAGLPGLLIPCRGIDATIRGFRVRPDDPGKDGGKYRWLSSSSRPCGAGSGVHCHVALPTFGTIKGEAAWITEGEIKADLSAEHLQARVISIPGVACWWKALDDLATLLPSGGRVVVALDADWPDKPQVHLAIWRLCQACRALGYSVEIATWNAAYKGLDDLLTAGLTPQRMAPENFPAPEWGLKVSSRFLVVVPPRPTVIRMQLHRMRGKLAEHLRGLSPCS